MSLNRKVLDLIDRVGRSTLQQFLVVAFAASPAVGFDSVRWYAALGMGLGAGAYTLVANLLSWKIPVLPFWPNALVRAGRTFLTTLLNLWTFDAFDVFNTEWSNQIWMALGAAGLSLATAMMVAGTSNGSGVAEYEPSPSLAYRNTVDELAATGKPLLGNYTAPAMQLTPEDVVGRYSTGNISTGYTDEWQVVPGGDQPDPESPEGTPVTPTDEPDEMPKGIVPPRATVKAPPKKSAPVKKAAAKKAPAKKAVKR